MEPPIKSTMRLLMANPNPVPPKRRVEEPSAWVKGQEQAFLFFLVEAYARVADAEMNLQERPFADSDATQHHDFALFGELDGVAHQYLQYLGQTQGIAYQQVGHVGLDADQKFQILPFGLGRP